MKELEYIIPIQDEESFKEINEKMGTDFKDTDWHVNNMMEKLADAIQQCGDDGGWYIGDDISVKVIVEYNPENK